MEKQQNKQKKEKVKQQEQKAVNWGKVYSSHADYLYIMLD